MSPRKGRTFGIPLRAREKPIDLPGEYQSKLRNEVMTRRGGI